MKIARKTGRNLGRHWKRIYFECISTECRKTKTKVIAKINIENVNRKSMKKRAEKRYMSRLIFVLNVIGGESGASFLNLSQSEVTQ